MNLNRTIKITLLAFFLGTGTNVGFGDDGKATVQHLTGKESVNLVNSEAKLIVVDVRTPEEFDEGHIKGAQNIDFNGIDFPGKLAKIDRDAPILVHCRSGRRSQASLKTFESLGFKKVNHLDGGIQAWAEAGGALER